MAVASVAQLVPLGLAILAAGLRAILGPKSALEGRAWGVGRQPSRLGCGQVGCIPALLGGGGGAQS